MQTNIEKIQKIYERFLALRVKPFQTSTPEERSEVRDLANALENYTPMLIGMVKAYESCLGTGILERAFAEPPVNEAEERKIHEAIKNLLGIDKYFHDQKTLDGEAYSAWEKARDHIYEHLQSTQRMVFVEFTEEQKAEANQRMEKLKNAGIQIADDDPVSVRVQRPRKPTGGA